MLKGMLLTLILTASIASAAAQVYNPNTPAIPTPPPPPVPPAAQPGMQPIPPLLGSSSASNPGRPAPRIGQGAPARESHNDKSIRCSQQAGALNLPASARGQYVRECVTN